MREPAAGVHSGIFGLDSKFLGGMPAPAWGEYHAAYQGNDICLAAGKDLFTVIAIYYNISYGRLAKRANFS